MKVKVTEKNIAGIINMNGFLNSLGCASVEHEHEIVCNIKDCISSAGSIYLEDEELEGLVKICCGVFEAGFELGYNIS